MPRISVTRISAIFDDGRGVVGLSNHETVEIETDGLMARRSRAGILVTAANGVFIAQEEQVLQAGLRIEEETPRYRIIHL